MREKGGGRWEADGAPSRRREQHFARGWRKVWRTRRAGLRATALSGVKEKRGKGRRTRTGARTGRAQMLTAVYPRARGFNRAA